VEDAPGSGYYTKTHTLDPTDGDPRFKFLFSRTRKRVSASSLVKVVNASALLGRYVDLFSSASSVTTPNKVCLEFDLTGDNLSVVFAKFAVAEANSVTVTDVLTGSQLGVINPNQASGASFGNVDTLTFPF